MLERKFCVIFVSKFVSFYIVHFMDPKTPHLFLLAYCEAKLDRSKAQYKYNKVTAGLWLCRKFELALLP